MKRPAAKPLGDDDQLGLELGNELRAHRGAEETVWIGLSTPRAGTPYAAVVPM